MSGLSERGLKILWAIIQSNIATNMPVSSHAVTRKYSFGLSAATIRNIMAELEKSGYITHPYTSAGRVPTEKGYRLYVDKILKRHTLYSNKKLLQQLSNRLRMIEKDINKLIREVSKTLSTFSHYLGIAIQPKFEEITLKRIEFIKYDKNKVFIILISEGGIVKNKIITLEDRIFTQQQFNKFANYLNNELSGFTLGEIKVKIISKISEEKTICDKLIFNALMLCKKAILLETENMFYTEEVSGTCHMPDFATTRQIKELFKAIEDKHFMVKLLDKMATIEGTQVFIGSENILHEIRELSTVASTYNDGHRTLGTIGVIGPKRMNYEKVIPIVDLTAKTLTQILSER